MSAAKAGGPKIVAVEEIPISTRNRAKGEKWAETVQFVQSAKEGQVLEIQTAGKSDARSLQEALKAAGFAAVTRNPLSKNDEQFAPDVRYVYVEV